MPHNGSETSSTPGRESAMIEVGHRFGALEVTGLRPGRKDVHPAAFCRCDCGQTRAVRLTNLRRGLVVACATCTMKAAWEKRERANPETASLQERESTYKVNARRRGLTWALSRDQFQALVRGSCRYCGEAPALGVDRKDNGQGYTPDNSVSCCSACNYAKRQMPAHDFLELVRRIFCHACAS